MVVKTVNFRGFSSKVPGWLKNLTKGGNSSSLGKPSNSGNITPLSSSLTSPNNNTNNNTNNANNVKNPIWNSDRVVEGEKQLKQAKSLSEESRAVKVYKHFKANNEIDSVNYLGHIKSPESEYQKEYPNVELGYSKDLAKVGFSAPLAKSEGHPHVLYTTHDSIAKKAIQGTTKFPQLESDLTTPGSVASFEKVTIPIETVSNTVGFKGPLNNNANNSVLQNITNIQVISSDTTLAFYPANHYSSNLTQEQKEEQFLAAHKAIMEVGLIKPVIVTDSITGQRSTREGVLIHYVHKDKNGKLVQETHLNE